MVKPLIEGVKTTARTARPLEPQELLARGRAVLEISYSFGDFRAFSVFRGLILSPPSVMVLSPKE